MRRLRPALGVSRHARRARLGVLPTICGACVLTLALLGPRAGRSTIGGYGVSWRAAAAVSSAGGPAGFGIGGSVGGLYPGDSAQLVLTVTNPQHFAIAVTSITAAVGTPRAGCDATNLTVGAFSSNLTVPAGGHASVQVPVTLASAAPDSCQGAEFPLTYSGLAHKA